ncbi:hypothetical protein, partial [Klebsiella pneumoniae]|uniref:hypothetical protein n=1 Tax=Klebsiella pneumoniae TaxID=573 RepID=UPI003B5AF48F
MRTWPSPFFFWAAFWISFGSLIPDYASFIVCVPLSTMAPVTFWAFASLRSLPVAYSSPAMAWRD